MNGMLRQGLVMHRAIMMAFVLLGGLGTAQAADAPSLLGTWSGKGPSLSSSDGWQTDRSYTLVVTEQRGAVFEGHNEWPGGQDDVRGVIKADGTSILLSNGDGEGSATLLGPDSMEACYVEGGEDGMAACILLTRSQ
jgi:hypothetical protein